MLKERLKALSCGVNEKPEMKKVGKTSNDEFHPIYRKLHLAHFLKQPNEEGARHTLINYSKTVGNPFIALLCTIHDKLHIL